MVGSHGSAHRYRVNNPQNSHPPWLFRGLSFPQELHLIPHRLCDSIQHRLCGGRRRHVDDQIPDVRQQFFEPQPTRSTRGGHLCIHRSTSFCWRWVRFCSRASRTLGSRGRSRALTTSRPWRPAGVLGLEVRQLDILAHLAFLPFSRSGSFKLVRHVLDHILLGPSLFPLSFSPKPLTAARSRPRFPGVPNHRDHPRHGCAGRVVVLEPAGRTGPRRFDRSHHVPKCQFPLAANHQITPLDRLTGRDTIPEGIIIRMILMTIFHPQPQPLPKQEGEGPPQAYPP